MSHCEVADSDTETSAGIASLATFSSAASARTVNSVSASNAYEPKVNSAVWYVSNSPDQSELSTCSPSISMTTVNPSALLAANDALPMLVSCTVMGVSSPAQMSVSPR